MIIPGVIPKNQGMIRNRPDKLQLPLNKIIYYVTFPRVGTHWFIHLSELYLMRPCYPRAYYYPNAKPWGTHVHPCVGSTNKDKFQRGDSTHNCILLLERNPQDVIYSVCRYFDVPPRQDSIHQLTQNYRKFNSHWEKKAKVVLCYDTLHSPNGHQEYQKFLNLFGESVDIKKFYDIRDNLTKRQVNSQMPRESKELTISRNEFKAEFGRLIDDIYYN